MGSNSVDLYRMTAASLRQRGEHLLELAKHVEEQVNPSTTGTHLSPAGLAKARAAASASWFACPQDCGKKHRRNHPHLRAGRGKVTAMQQKRVTIQQKRAA